MLWMGPSDSMFVGVQCAVFAVFTAFHVDRLNRMARMDRNLECTIILSVSNANTNVAVNNENKQKMVKSVRNN